MISPSLWWRVHRHRVLGVSALILLGLAVGLFVFSVSSRLHRGRGISREPAIVGGTLDVLQIPEGPHTLAVRATTSSGASHEAQVSVVITHATVANGGGHAPLPPPTEGRDDPDIASPLVDDPALGGALRPKGSGVIREAETEPRLVGDVEFSGVVTDGTRRVVALSQPNAQALYYLQSAPESRVLLELRARHDAPAPVEVAVSLNGKSWKRVVLGEGDGVYRTHRVGILRNFSGGVIGLRLVNDLYDTAAMDACGEDAACRDRNDRNFYLDWLRLVPIE